MRNVNHNILSFVIQCEKMNKTRKFIHFSFSWKISMGLDWSIYTNYQMKRKTINTWTL